MAPRRGNSHIEFGNKLRIVSAVIHYKAPISLDVFISYLRAPVCKNQTKSKFRGKGGKFDFFHILMLDRLGYN